MCHADVLPHGSRELHLFLSLSLSFPLSQSPSLSPSLFPPPPPPPPEVMLVSVIVALMVNVQAKGLRRALFPTVLHKVQDEVLSRTRPHIIVQRISCEKEVPSGGSQAGNMSQTYYNITHYNML